MHCIFENCKLLSCYLMIPYLKVRYQQKTKTKTKSSTMCYYNPNVFFHVISSQKIFMHMITMIIVSILICDFALSNKTIIIILLVSSR